MSCIIVAAGKSRRFHGRVPKVFVSLHGKSLLEFCTAAFENAKNVQEIILVVPGDRVSSPATAALKKKYPKIRKIVPGGRVREESVYNGLKNCSPLTGYVLVHDGARPFVSRRLIENVLVATRKYGACVPALAVVESLKEVRGDYIETSLKGKRFYTAQTPQGFAKEALLQAMERVKDSLGSYPDESSLFGSAGLKVRTVKGEKQNIKITTREDFRLAQKLLKI